MQDHGPIAIAHAWQEAANEQQIDRLLALSDPAIELVGPRGIAQGHQVLRDWLGRAGLRLGTLRTFARDAVVVLEQRGDWRSPETGEPLGEAIVATIFKVAERRVTHLARHDSLDVALSSAGLSHADEVSPN
jgi:hypothetical protein